MNTTHLCQLHVVVIQLLFHDLLQHLQCEDLSFLQSHRLQCEHVN